MKTSVNRNLPECPNQSGWPWENTPELTDQSFMPNGRPWPSVTVVMPSYNQGSFLEEAIRSILLQNYPALQFYVFDGGSTDQSVKIIQKYASFIDYWRSEPDQGQSAAINEGFERSNSEYIAWLNSDDVYLPGCIHHLVTIFMNDPYAGMVYAQVNVINEAGARVGSFEKAQPTLSNLLSFQAILPQQAALFRYEALRDVGFLNTDLHYAMDHELFIRIAARYPIVSSDEVKALFRMSTINKGMVHRTRWAQEFVKIAEDFFTRNDLSDQQQSLKNQAIGGAYFRGGASYLEAYDTWTALIWFLKAAQISPKYIRQSSWWKKVLRAVSGRLGNHALQLVRNRLSSAGLYQNEHDWQTGLETNNTRKQVG